MVPQANIPAIAALRATACLLVVYAHNLAESATRHGVDWAPTRLVNFFVVDPLGIIQNFGFFGVALFFVISGFIITHSAQEIGRWTFAVRRFFRIYPPIVVAVPAAIAVGWLHFWLTGSPNKIQQVSLLNNILSMTALAPLFHIDGPLDVMWTLTIELFFYAYVLVLLPLVQVKPIAACISLLAITLVATTVFARPGIKVFGVMHEYLPVFVTGMLIYYVWSGRMALRTGLVIGVLAWGVLIYGLRNIQPWNLAQSTSFTTQILYVVVLFVTVLLLTDQSAPNSRPVRFFSDISYSLYLLHLPIGALVIDRLFPYLGFTAAAMISFAVVVVLSAGSHAAVERPFQRLARRLTRRESASAMPPADETVLRQTPG